MERRRSTVVGDSGAVAAVTLSQMVDMALNSPEVGAVRFNILQSLLHAILRTLGISEVQAHYDVTQVTATELTDTAASAEDDIVPLGRMHSQRRSSVGVPMLHIVMPTAATCELVPSPGTPFHEMADKVKQMEVRLEKLYKTPSNEEILSDTGINRAGEGGVTKMWQNMQMSRRVEANADGLQELMTVVNKLIEENRKQWDEAQSLRQQVENISRIINAEMEVPSFVTWSGLEEILKGVNRPLEDASGPSSALKDHLKIIGKVDQDVTVLEGKCQVLDEKVQVHEVTLNRITPDVVNLMSTIKSTSGEISNFLKLKKSHHSDIQLATDVEISSENNGFDSLAGNVRQLVSERDENINKINENVSCSSALTEKRLLALEEALEELSVTVKTRIFDLTPSASDIELSSSGRYLSEDLSMMYVPVEPRGSILGEPRGSISAERQGSLSGGARGSIAGGARGSLSGGARGSVSGGFDVGQLNTANPTVNTPPLSDVSDPGKTNTAVPALIVSASLSPTIRKPVTGDLQEVYGKLGQLNRKFRLQIKQERLKMDEFESKLRDITEHVSKLRSTVSCDEAEESSCLRLMQRSIDQLQTDVRNVTEMGLEAKSLLGKVQHFEVSQEDMLSDLSEVKGNFNQLQSLIADLESNMQAEEAAWNQFLRNMTDELDDSMKRIHLEMVSVRKDVQCHLHKLNDDVSQLHVFLDEFGDSGAGMRRRLKFQCLSCDRKLLVTPLEPPLDSCPAQAGFQSALSAHPYTSYEMENIRNRQKNCLLPKQLTNFQRAILERHMARLRMRDFRSYFMQCWNDLPEVKMAKSYNCSTIYEKQAEMPDVYSQLPRNSGGPMHMQLQPSPAQISPNYGNRKDVEFVDVFNLTQTTSANTVGNKSSDMASSKPTANTNLPKRPRNTQMPSHTRRNMSNGKRLTKCQKLLASEYNPQEAKIVTSREHSVTDLQTQQTTSVDQLVGITTVPSAQPSKESLTN